MTAVRTLLWVVLSLPLVFVAGYVYEQDLEPLVRWCAYGYLALVGVTWARLIRRLT